MDLQALRNRLFQNICLLSRRNHLIICPSPPVKKEKGRGGGEKEESGKNKTIWPTNSKLSEYGIIMARCHRKIYVVCSVGFLVHCPALSESLLPRCEHPSIICSHYYALCRLVHLSKKEGTSTWPRVTSKRLTPWQGAFPPLVDHPGRCHLDCQSATRVTTCLLTIETHPSLSTWSCTSISVEGQVAWPFFFCALDLMGEETTSYRSSG